MEKEKQFSPETEKKIESKVILEFIKHGERENEPNKPNEELLLTKRGRKQVIKKGEKLNPQSEVALAWTSPRLRTKETAALIMLNGEDINSEATLEEMEQAIDQSINNDGKKKKKIIEDPRLDYNFNQDGIGQWVADFPNLSTPFFPTYIKESDQRALEIRDTISDTYTRKAKDIAEIVLKYIKVGQAFNRLVQKTDKYEKTGQQLERYLITHSSVLEPFLIKLEEKLNGPKARDELAKAIGNGFEKTQGMHIEILHNHDGEQEITIDFTTEQGPKKIKANVDIIEEIIKEGEEFEKKFEKK